LKIPGQFFNFKPHQPLGVLHPAPVFILGMHRSGTSAFGGALESLGLSVGKTVMPPQPDNPKGFYENISLTEFHDKFLSSIGSAWRDPQPVVEDRFQGNVARRFQKKLPRLLIGEFGEDRQLIKDPRLCRLMSLWIPLIKEHFPLAQFVLPIRHPVEVASSLHERDKLPLGEGLKLWVVHVLESERTTRAFSRLFTTYDQLMLSPLETLLHLAKKLGLPADAIPAVVSRQIDSKLRHHKQLAWPAGEPHAELTLSIYQALVSDEPAMKEKLDRLRREYYGHMGWRC
jgi:hypothetical protein